MPKLSCVVFIKASSLVRRSMWTLSTKDCTFRQISFTTW